MAPSLEAERPSRLEGDSGGLYGGCDSSDGGEEALSPGFGGRVLGLGFESEHSRIALPLEADQSSRLEDESGDSGEDGPSPRLGFGG